MDIAKYIEDNGSNYRHQAQQCFYYVKLIIGLRQLSKTVINGIDHINYNETLNNLAQLPERNTKQEQDIQKPSLNYTKLDWRQQT